MEDGVFSAAVVTCASENQNGHGMLLDFVYSFCKDMYITQL